MLVIPKIIIDKIVPSKDFTIKMSISIDNISNHFGFIPLGDVINDEVIKSSESLTHAILSAGEYSLDYDGYINILSTELKVQKFDDLNVKKKLVMAMNEAVVAAKRNTPVEFMMDNGANIKVKCTIQLSKELRDVLTSRKVGYIKL